MIMVHATRESRFTKRETLSVQANFSGAYLDALPTAAPESTEGLYRLLGKVERDIGGDAGIIGMSGSICRPDMAKILAAMQVDDKSNFLDIGSGLGRPMLHALHFGAASATGIEFDAVKHAKCQTVISRILPLADQVRTCCINKDVLAVSTLEELHPAITHVFSFWEGINMDAREAVGRLVAASWHKYGRIRTVAFVQAHQDKVEQYTRILSFPAQMSYVKSFAVSMMGSAAKFQAYIFCFPSSQDQRISLTMPSSVMATSVAHLPSSSRMRKKRRSSMSGFVLQSSEAVLGDFVIERRHTRASRTASTQTTAIGIIPEQDGGALAMRRPDIAVAEVDLVPDSYSYNPDFRMLVPVSISRSAKRPRRESSQVKKPGIDGGSLPVPLGPCDVVFGDYIVERRATRSRRQSMMPIDCVGELGEQAIELCPVSQTESLPEDIVPLFQPRANLSRKLQSCANSEESSCSSTPLSYPWDTESLVSSAASSISEPVELFPPCPAAPKAFIAHRRNHAKHISKRRAPSSTNK